MLSPCKDCTARKPMCHSECERYKKYREELENQRKWEKKMKGPRIEFSHDMEMMLRRRRRK